MKKITAFFMAIMPVFVLVLLFVSGLIIKSSTTVSVSAVNIVQEDFERKITDLKDTKQNSFEVDAVVFPRNATNPEVYWASQDESILTIDQEGFVTATGYGETYLWAVSKDDPTKKDSIKVGIYDTVMHDIKVNNQYDLNYVGLNQQVKIDASPVPSAHVVNKTLKFESQDTDVLEVAGDGWIMPKKEGTAKVKITADDKSSTAVKEVEVTIGKGVDALAINDQSTTITSSSFYNLFSNLVTSPETDLSKIPATDFIYETSSAEDAYITSNGIAYLKTQNPVTLTATYRRNPKLKVEKSVRSTCNNVLSVDFSANEYEITLDTKLKEGSSTQYEYVPADITDVKLNIFPTESSLFDDITVESSDDNVVLPYISPDTGLWTFKALKPGTATLLAYSSTGLSQEPYKFDACLIKVLSPCQESHSPDKAIINKDTVVLPEGMFYYPLRKNLSLDVEDKLPQDVTFKIIEGSDIATINNDEFINFSEPGTAKVKIYLDKLSSSATFTIVAQDKTEEITYDSSKSTYVIECGKKYKFSNNVAPVWTLKSYRHNFNYNTSANTFSAIKGQNISDFEIELEDGTYKTIQLIVTEQPLYINTECDSFYHTQDTEVNFKDVAQATIVPSSATKTDGTGYSLNYVYTPASEETAVIEDDKITFKQIGLVEAVISCDELAKPQVIKIKSSMGALDKFDLYNGEEKISSGKQYDLAPGTSLTLNSTVSGLTTTEANQINIESVSDTKLCKVESYTEEATLLKDAKRVFTITPNANKYGVETFAIKTLSYTTFVNINVSSEVKDVDLVYNNQVLSSDNPTLTFMNSLDLTVLTYPIVVKNPDVKVTLDGAALTITDNKISLTNLSVGDHKLIFKWTNNAQEVTKEYTITYSDDYSKLKVTIAEATEDNNIYLAANNTLKTLRLTTNGLVPTSFFASSDFSASFTDSTLGKTEISHNLLTLRDLPDPAKGTFADKELVLKYKDTVLSTYKVTRDLVSKVVLPKHDNLDPNDKKGMQKVHVYGNRSFYTGQEGVIDYYKLPIKVYDYKGDEIVNTTESPSAKANAIATLDITMTKGTASYDATNDFVKVSFDTASFYNELEIANNEFDAENGNKNVKIDAASKSKEADANYTFVVVEGVNIYCQDAFNWNGLQGHRNRLVLQTNFGLDDAKENVPLTTPVNYIAGMYGNGYTIDFDQVFKKYPNQSELRIAFAINVIYQGCNDDTYTSHKSSDLLQGKFNIGFDKKLYPNYFLKYFTYKNWLWGWDAAVGKKEICPSKISNSLFINNKGNSIITNEEYDQKTYIEDCLFIDCTGFTICQGQNSSIYFKGYLGLYNFHNKEMLSDFWGFDLSSLWPLVEKAATSNNMSEKGADGRIYVNSFMGAMKDNIYFWNNKTQQYEKGSKGTPDAANFTAKYFDLKVPFTSFRFSLWATYNKTVSPDAFSYYDEFDLEGNKRVDFLFTKIEKLCREINWF